jgi:U3 small nucleolar RNA-associated protein 4
MTTIRMFNLSESEDDDEENTLQIKDVKLPRQITDDGARNVSLSPDLRWLSIIRPGNDTYLAKLSVTDTDAGKDVQVNPKLLRLQRSSGRTQTLRGINQGTLGDYDRTIRTVTFSSDSRLFATGDLAGFVDSWVLEDVSEQATKKLASGNTSSDDESSDDDDDDIEKVLDGERWKLLAAMPCLHSGIIFMSFRPATKPTTEDRLLLLTSRHQLTEYEVLSGKFSDWSQRNPKSCLPEEFIGLKDRAIGGVCDVFQGLPKLLLYGPSWMWMFDLTHDFPSQSVDVDDIKRGTAGATGAAQGGTSDAALAIELVQAAMGKRKRDNDNDNEHEELDRDEFDANGDENEHWRRKYNSGAGDLIPKSQAMVSMGTKMRKITGNRQNSKQQWIDVEKHRLHQHQDDEEAEEGDSHPFFVNGEPDFARLRRQIANDPTTNEDSTETPKKMTNGTVFNSPATNGASFAVVINKSTQNPEQQQQQQLTSTQGLDSKPTTIFWHSYKFRDILGVLPLGSASHIDVVSSSSTTSTQKSVELAVIERPMWDMELGERYVKDYE